MAYILLNKRPVVETDELAPLKDSINDIAALAMLSFDELPSSPYGATFNISDGQIAYDKDNDTFSKASITWTAIQHAKEDKIVIDKCQVFDYETLPDTIRVFYSSLFEKYYDYNTLEEITVADPSALVALKEHKQIIKYDINNLPIICPVFIDNNTNLEVYYYSPMQEYYYVSDGSKYNGSVGSLSAVYTNRVDEHEYDYYTYNSGADTCFKYNNKYYSDPFTEIPTPADPEPVQVDMYIDGKLIYDANGTLLYFSNGQYIRLDNHEVYKDTGATITWVPCDISAPNITATTKITSPDIKTDTIEVNQELTALKASVEEIQQSMLNIHSDTISMTELTTGVATMSGQYNFTNIHSDTAILSGVQAGNITALTGIYSNITTDRAEVLTGVFSRLEYNGDELGTLLSGKMDANLKGAANGVAELDANGRVPYSQLPEAALTYEGSWNASTNTPTLVDGTGTQGMYYDVTVAGTQDLGSGNITFYVGDAVIYNGSTWNRRPGGTVYSVNGESGNVTLDASIPCTKNDAILLKDSSNNTIGVTLSNTVSSIVYSNATLNIPVGYISAYDTVTLFDGTTKTISTTEDISCITTVMKKIEYMDSRVMSQVVQSVNSKTGTVVLRSNDIPDSVAGNIGRITAGGNYYYVNYSSNTEFLNAIDTGKIVAIYSDTSLLICVGKGKKSGSTYYVGFFDGTADAQITAYSFGVTAPATTVDDKIQKLDTQTSNIPKVVAISKTSYDQITPDPDTIYLIYP